MNTLAEIYQWQVDAGNASRPYDDYLESSFQVEEALEGHTDLEYLAECIDDPDSASGPNPTPKDLSRFIVGLANDGYVEIPDVDRLDKACDAIVFAVGSIAKLGLTPEQLERALLVVNSANQQKLSMPRDSHGKLTKPDDFVGPEPELQKILDERT
jgi:hypothetical protein